MIGTSCNTSAEHRCPWTYILSATLAWWLVAVPLASSAKAQNAEWGIWVMRPDGSDVRMVAQIEGCKKHTCPRWSHDGKQILFAATPGYPRQSSLYLVNADGTGLKKLGAGMRAAWSPDDKQIALEMFTNSWSTNVQNLDGRGRTQLSPYRSPSWSGDGSRLAVMSRNNVEVIDLVTGESHMLFRNPKDVIYYGFTWFPDGKRLAIALRPQPRKTRQLLYVSAEGEDEGLEVRMTHEVAGFISFSPDGKKLALDAAYKINIVEVEGSSEPIAIPGQKGANRDPDWSPDGEWIAFTSSRDPM